MQFTLKGKLTEKFDTLQVSDKFSKREFVVETKEASGNGQIYVETIKFQLTNQKCNLIDSTPLNSEVEVSFNIRGKRFEKDGKVSYFNNLEAWKVQTTDAANRAATAFNKADEPVRTAVETQEQDESGLPF